MKERFFLYLGMIAHGHARVMDTTQAALGWRRDYPAGQ